MKVRSAERVTLCPNGSIILPETIMQELGWEQGDDLWIEVQAGDQVVLTKRRHNVAADFAGAFTDLYPDPEDTRRFLDEGRGYSTDENSAETRSA